MKIKKILYLSILIAIIARFIGLNYAPPHLSNDEIGAAYTAYSISKTNKDGYSERLPLLWQSHGGYGSPAAIYAPIASILFFGNNDFAVRLPSAVLGSLTIIFIGLLVNQITNNKFLALVTSFVLAVSPWHFLASRSALESNYALFFIVLGLYLFFLSLEKNKYWVILFSAISFAISIYSYYTEWVLTPLIIVSLMFLYKKVISKTKVYYLAIVLIGLLLIPLFINFIQNLSSSRASSEFITKDIGVGRLLSQTSNSFTKIQIVFKAIFDKYSSYNSFDYLFFTGAKILPKGNPYQFGFFLTPFLITFIYGLFKLKNNYKENTTFVYLLLLLSPIVAATTEGDLNNWRSLPQLLPVALIVASGVVSFWEDIENNFLMKFLFASSLVVSFFYFFFIFFRHFPLQRSVDYQYGYKQMSLFINLHYDDYQKFIIDQRFGDKNYYYVGVPSSYIPFYTKTDPIKVQNAVYLTNGIAFDKYEFRNINWNGENIQKGFLYIIPYDIIPNTKDNLKLINQIKLPDWRPAFNMYSLED